MQSRMFYFYAVAGSMMNEKSDYLDCFWPIVVCSMVPDTLATVAAIQNAMQQKYTLGIPQHVVSVLLRRAERKGYVRYEVTKHTYALTPKGADYAHDTRAETDAMRRVNSLTDSICAFFAARQVKIDHDSAETLLFRFAEQNLDLILPYLSPSSAPRADGNSTDLQGNERLLLAYVQEANRADPQQYATLEDVVIGAVLTILLTKPDDTEVLQYQKKARDCAVYLDTNVLISMLGLHPQERCAAASELLSLLKAAGIRPRVFDFTVDELCSLIAGYQGNSYKYVAHVAVDDVYGVLKRKGWGPEDARSYVTHIDEHLHAIGVEIEDVPAVQLETYTPQRPELTERIAQYKPHQYNRNSLNHDLAAIDQIIVKRKGSRRTLERCGAVFVTSDGNLARFNFECYDHRGTATLCEVIPDRALATMLWLKNPTGSPPMKLILATYSREAGVHHRIWNRFMEIMLGLLKDKKITDDDVSAIMYDPTIEETLSAISPGCEQTIDDTYVLHRAEAARSRELQTQSKQLQAQNDAARLRERQLMDNMAIANRDLLQKNAREWEQHAEKQRKTLRANATRNSTLLSGIICLCLTVAIACTLLDLPSRMQDAVKLVFRYILQGGSTTTLLWTTVEPWLRRRFFRWMYDRDLARLDLPETREELVPEAGSPSLDAEKPKE